MDINPEGKKKPCRHRIYRVFAIRRGRRIRTLNKGFGDPRVTITPCPYIRNITIIGVVIGVVKEKMR